MTYSARYADPSAVANRQLALLARWGTKIEPGATVLEVGCADGFATAAFVKAGYQVTALDGSPEMVGAAAARLGEGASAQLELSDVRMYEPRSSFDAVVAFMWTFFHYIDEPG